MTPKDAQQIALNNPCFDPAEAYARRYRHRINLGNGWSATVILTANIGLE